MRGFVLLLLVLLPWPALAQASADVTATYSLALIGVPIAELRSHLIYAPTSYSLEMRTRTLGVADALVHGEQVANANGRWAAMPEPERYDTSGTWNGEPHRTVIEFSNGMPTVRVLVPPEKSNHLPVPPDLLHDTIDSLTTFAALARQVALTGRCEMQTRVFDGLHLFAISGRTAGEEVLKHDVRSVFSGPALRCDFEGQMIAGFSRGEENKQRHPLHATAWLARIGPGWPPMPVKATFETRYFGDAVATLIAPTPVPTAAPASVR